MRSLDRSLSAAEVVALAEKKGLRLTPAFVYNIRSAEAARSSPARSIARGARHKVVKATTLGGSPEALLRAAIAQIGLVRAREILDEVEDTFAGR